MATKRVTRRKASAQQTSAAALSVLHAAYVTIVPRGAPDYVRHADEWPSLRKLAKVYGVPFADADKACHLDHWNDERRANEALDWRSYTHPTAPVDEASFIPYVMAARTIGSPDPRKEPKRYAVSVAMARALWWRTMAHVAKWEAIKAELAARVEHGEAAEAAGKGEV